MEITVVTLLLVGVVYFVIKMLGKKPVDDAEAAPYKIETPVAGCPMGDRAVQSESVTAAPTAVKLRQPGGQKPAASKKPQNKKPAASKKPATKKPATKKPATKKPATKKK